MVSQAEATTSAVGSLTSGSDHISPAGAVITSAPVGSGCTSAHEEVFAPVLAAGVKARPLRMSPLPPRRMTSCTASQCSQRSGRSRGCGWPAHSTTIARAVDGQPRSAPAVGCSAGGGARATQAEKPGTRHLTAPQTVNALLPRTLREEAGRYPHGGGASTRHTPLPSTDDEHP
jgi:hypothetical protein